VSGIISVFVKPPQSLAPCSPLSRVGIKTRFKMDNTISEDSSLNAFLKIEFNIFFKDNDLSIGNVLRSTTN